MNFTKPPTSREILSSFELTLESFINFSRDKLRSTKSLRQLFELAGKNATAKKKKIPYEF